MRFVMEFYYLARAHQLFTFHSFSLSNINFEIFLSSQLHAKVHC